MASTMCKQINWKEPNATWFKRMSQAKQNENSLWSTTRMERVYIYVCVWMFRATTSPWKVNSVHHEKQHILFKKIDTDNE